MSGSVPNTPASLAAISGVTGARPFTIAETCLRLTPSASAAWVTVTPSGPMYISARISPGWAGLCMRPELSMVVFIVDLVCVSPLEAEGHAVIFIHPDRMPPTFQGVISHPRHCHLPDLRRGIEGGQNEAQAL